MASIKPGTTVVDIRGKIGDLVYSRNNAGPFIRERIDPTPSSTQLQLDQRTLLTSISRAWSATLTEPQRKTWRQYARSWPRLNRWGQPSVNTGQCAFVRANAYIYRVNQTFPFTSAPPAGPLPPPAFNFTADGAADTVTIALPPITFPVPFAGLRLYAFVGPCTAAGVNYFSNPWRYAATNLFTAAWETDPWTFANPWPSDVGLKSWAYLVAQDNVGGQLSTRSQASQTVT